MLRYMAWLCFGNQISQNTQMCIITGPRIELAITLIDRMKRLFHNIGATFDNKETVIELNSCHIEAYPSHHLDSYLLFVTSSTGYHFSSGISLYEHLSMYFY
jgi:hypothetical protein